MRVRQDARFNYGYHSIVESQGTYSDLLMDFGILKLGKDHFEADNEDKERAYLLIQGEVVFEWDGNKVHAGRRSCFDENPWCLHVPPGVEVRITSMEDYSEVAVHKTINQKKIKPRLYRPEECRSEERGKGTMQETSTRIVRTIFDKTNSEDANLVLGEVINFPGKWSSYPPHHHPQPEIYYYKFYPEHGYGHGELGDEVYKVKNDDTLLITEGRVHSQVAAPGYAMYYLWAIRHLDGNPYIQPVFVEEYSWVADKDAKIWPGPNHMA